MMTTNPSEHPDRDNEPTETLPTGTPSGPPGSGAHGSGPAGTGAPWSGPAGTGTPGGEPPRRGAPPGGWAPPSPSAQNGPNPATPPGPVPTPGGAGGFGSPLHATPPPPPPPAPPTSQRPRRGVGVVVTAIIAGALAGLGGAAAYDSLTDDASVRPSNTSLDSPASNVSDKPAPKGSVQEVANAILPSVVMINAGAGSGSGIVISADGLILTNNHVVEGASEGGELAVSFNDGSTASADVLGTDPVTDLAVIQAEDVSGLKPATLGSSSDLAVGQQVVAVGSPFGLDSTVTSGIVSALNRPVSAGGSGQGEPTVFPAVQTDAAINPGNSGGPLVNMRGEVIGINSAIYSPTSITGQSGSVGLGFAVPIDEARPIANQLVDGEEPSHAQIGVTVTNQSGENGLSGGAQVHSIEEDSAADGAGLEQGDLITRVDEHVITTSDDLVAIVRTFRPGDEVSLTVLRDGDEQQIDLTLGSDTE
ncbi:MAG: PDZ domain-containing protein [Propionibacteriales bacterium]|nr:PDZ domain-containing protein [Propionibacteriales bacterium]